MKLLLRTVSLVVTTIILATGLTFVDSTSSTESAAAASGEFFDAGNIVSDAVFYDARSMTERQIQLFLQSQVSTCKAGYTCLKDYRQNSTDQPARSEGCSAFTGWANESAASIIQRVAVTCGISPRTLLVLLEKEQGLVTRTSPTDSIYRKATGYGCPDTASCDANFYGFFNQVYNAAWMFKKYQARPDRGYVAGQWNTVQWHPSAACGTSQVYIQNQATAGLYIYTPYRPNGAALSNMYGSGDSCSSYGNRNFWRIFTDWFGSTGYSLHPELWSMYSSMGGATGPLGAIAAAAITGPDAGLTQRFADGWAYWHPSTGAVPTGGAIGQRYVDMGATQGVLGYPVARETSTANGGAIQQFQGGFLNWSPSTDISLVFGGMNTAYKRLGGPNGGLGSPIADEKAGPGNGTSQQFAGGVIYWTSAGGYRVFGALAQVYANSGGPAGSLGYPISDEASHGADRASQRFQGALVYWTPSAVRRVFGGMLTTYLGSGGPSGPLGAPVGDEVTDGQGGTSQSFEGGTTFWSAATGGKTVMNPIRSIYLAAGGPTGTYGYPVGEATAFGTDGVSQTFLNGMITTSPTGTQRVSGGILAAYVALGGPRGEMGAPVSAEIAEGNLGASQTFAGGKIYWSASAGGKAVRGGTLVAYQNLGGPQGTLGMPTTVETSDGVGGATQGFMNGSIYWSGATGGQVVREPIRSAYRAAGGPAGSYGSPVEAALSFGTARLSQRFQTGQFVTTASGTYGVLGGTQVAYAKRGGTTGVLGAPTGTEAPDGIGGTRQAFEGGALLWAPSVGGQSVSGGLAQAYNQWGGPQGVLGYPLGDEVSDGRGGASQRFQSGVLYWTPNGTFRIFGGILTTYLNQGGARGALGAPRGNEIANGTGGVSQAFQNGTINWPR